MIKFGVPSEKVCEEPWVQHERPVFAYSTNPSGKGNRDITPGPVLIRKGLACTEIMELMSEHFISWDYRHGHYY